MTDELRETAARAFERHDGFEPDAGEFAVTSTIFEGRVSTRERDGKLVYTVTVWVPTLDAATADEVGLAVSDGWFETLERRLEEAPKATRASVDLDGFVAERVGEVARIEYEFTWGNTDRAADIAKTFVEYVEGTYVEGIVPGYEYEPPVSDLLARASQGGETGTPL